MAAVVVGGSFFGDNLSFISDTTIVATSTQGCKLSDKFRVNSFIVIPAAMLILYLSLVVLLMPSLANILFNIVSALNILLTKMASIPGASIDNLHPTKIQTTMIYVIIVAVYLLAVKLTYIRASARCR